MNTSIPQNSQNDKDFFSSVQIFFKRFHVSSALKAANAYKSKGTPVIDVFRYLFMLVFSNSTMYLDRLNGKEIPFGKDTVYRFMKQTNINWLKLTTILASRIIRKAIDPLDSEDRVDVLVVDDSLYQRNRSKKVELLSKVYDHAHKAYYWGFRMLTLGWSDGTTFLPINSVLLSGSDSARINDATFFDKRTLAFKRRNLSKSKGTDAMISLIQTALAAKISAKYVLFDSWFSSPKTLHAVKELGINVIAMIKRSPKVLFGYEGKHLNLREIYAQNRKRRGRSKYLLSVIVDIEKDGIIIPAKVVYVRNRSNRKDYLCLISTDVDLDEEEIIRIYGKRWDIEVFFKVCKSYLRLAKECNALSYDSITAHTAIVFVRYMMLTVTHRENEDQRSLGALVAFFTEEIADITWIESFQLIMLLFKELLVDEMDMDSSIIDARIEQIILALPSIIQSKLQKISA